jgi:hypothetical protein
MRSSLGFDLRALQVFATVCELRNMTLAAKRLGMTQPAVSYTIKQLEDVMGVKLIDRNRRPLSPIPSKFPSHCVISTRDWRYGCGSGWWTRSPIRSFR